MSAADYMRGIVEADPRAVVEAATSLGIQYFSPTKDATYKRLFVVPGDDNRAASFVGALLRIAVQNGNLGQLSDGQTLGGRRCAIRCKLPEAIKQDIEIKSKPQQRRGRRAGRRTDDGERDRSSSSLPKSPKIDSGFGVRIDNDVECKVGIEMQVAYDKKISVRLTDYGCEIASYKFGEGSEFESLDRAKTYEFGLCMWDLANNRTTLALIDGKSYGSFDREAPQNLIGQCAVCCVQIFLGSIANTLGKVISELENKSLRSVKTAIEHEKNRKISELEAKFRAYFNLPGDLPTWPNDVVECFEWLQFFSCGHLMSESDVSKLRTETVKGAFMSIRINEENVRYDVEQSGEIWLGATLINRLKRLAAENAELREVNERITRAVATMERGSVTPDRILQTAGLMRSPGGRHVVFESNLEDRASALGNATDGVEEEEESMAGDPFSPPLPPPPSFSPNSSSGAADESEDSALLDDPVVGESDYSRVAKSLCESTTGEYARFIKNLGAAQVPWPKMPFKNTNAVCSPSNAELTAKRQETDDYLRDFSTKTNVDVSQCGRTIVNMSGEGSLCGYRAILSQVDPECSGAALAHPSQGGTKSMLESTIRKICALRLAIVVGKAKEGCWTRSEARSKMEIALEGGIRLEPLDTGSITHIAQMLGRNIAVVSDHGMRSRPGWGDSGEPTRGASLEMNYRDGTWEHFNDLRSDDTPPEGRSSEGSVRKAREKQQVLVGVLKDPNAIVLYHVHGNHYRAVQRQQLPVSRPAKGTKKGK